MKIAVAVSSLTLLLYPSPLHPFFTLYRGWKYKIPLRVAWPSCLCIRKICKLNSFQFLFVPSRSSCASLETPSSLLLRLARLLQKHCLFDFRGNGSGGKEASEQFPSLKIQRPKNSRFSPSTFRHELGGNKCFAFFQRLQILAVHATD